MRKIGLIAGVAAALGLMAPHASARDLGFSTTLSNYGTSGIIDMPNAISRPDADLTFALTSGIGTTRATLTFQITPRLSGTFRYTHQEAFTGPGTPSSLDRSFDLQFRLLNETRYRPAVAVGLRDFIGTGRFSSEYVVATKHVTPRLRFSVGMGWGRLGTYNGFSNPLGILDGRFKTRPVGGVGLGGEPEIDRLFRGDAALFGGIEWRASDRLTLKAEYSSDDYARAQANGLLDKKSPFNFGLNYQWRPGIEVTAAYLYGDTLGIGISLTLNPKTDGVPGGSGAAPQPVEPRQPADIADLGWTVQADAPEIIEGNVQAFFEPEGVILEAIKLEPRSVRVYVRNTRFGNSAEFIGRTARALTGALPASIETLVIVPVENGVPMSAVTIQRSDMEQLEHAPDGAWQSFVRARFEDAADFAGYRPLVDGNYPKFRWAIEPYSELSPFDPDVPLLYDFGVQFRARYEIAPGWILAGKARQSVVSNFDESTRVSNSVIQKVRSDANVYQRESQTELTNLTLSHYGRPGPNLYSRFTFGYLEQMYGGFSGELLWKPVDSRFALGVELNYVKQREFQQQFGFRSYEVATGHVSGYWDMGNGFHGQVDVGRYLAGDWGATFSLDREFNNGWRIGAFATLTTVSFNDFGEGSFDKGIRLTIPLQSLTGQPSKRRLSGTLRPLTRDGGARVNVDGRLYEMVRDYHKPVLGDQWGRFWR